MKQNLILILSLIYILFVGCSQSAPSVKQENIVDNNVSIDNRDTCVLLESELPIDTIIKENDDECVLSDVILDDVDSLFAYVPWSCESKYYSREIEFPATENKSLNDSIIAGLRGLLPLSDTSVYIQNLEKEVSDVIKEFCDEMNGTSIEFFIDDNKSYQHCFVGEKVVTYVNTFHYDRAGMPHGTMGSVFSSYRLIDGRKFDKSMVIINDEIKASLRPSYNEEEYPAEWSRPFFYKNGLCFPIEYCELDRYLRGNYYYIPWSMVSQFLTEEGKTFVPNTFVTDL